MRSIMGYIGASLLMISGTVGAATVDCATVMSTPSMLCHPYLSATEPDNTETCIRQCTINMPQQVGPGSYGGDVVNAGIWGQFNNTCPPRYTLLGVRFVSGFNTGNYNPTTIADMGQKVSEGWTCGPAPGASSTISGVPGTRPNQSGPAIPGAYLEYNGVWFVETAQFDGNADCIFPTSNCYDTSAPICNPDGTAVAGAILKHSGPCTPADGWSKTCSCTPPPQTVRVKPVVCAPPAIPSYQASGVPLLIAVCGYSGTTYTAMPATVRPSGCGTVPSTNAPASVDSSMVCPPVMVPVLIDSGSTQTPSYQ